MLNLKKKYVIKESFWSFYWDLNYKTKWHMAHYVVQKSGHTDGASTSEKKIGHFRNKLGIDCS